jgi:hypothetical protein
MVAFGFLSLLAPLFGGASKGVSDARTNANQQALSYDRNRLDAQQSQQQAIMQALLGGSNEQSRHADIDLSRRNFALGAPSVRGKQALLGSLMQNMQPVSFSGLSPQLSAKMPKISGGLNPAAIGPLARQMGLLMQQNALSGQQKGDVFSALTPTDFKAGVLPQVQMTPPKKAGLLEKILGGLSLGGSVIGALPRRGGSQMEPSDTAGG